MTIPEEALPTLRTDTYVPELNLNQLETYEVKSETPSVDLEQVGRFTIRLKFLISQPYFQ